MNALRIAIVGAGPAGLASAIALRQGGHEVVLVDRAPQSRVFSDAGGGYELDAETMRTLDALGAATAVRRAGQCLSRFELRDARGRTLKSLRLDGAGVSVFSITRAALQRALWERAESLGCDARFGDALDDVARPGERRARLSLASGTIIDADLVVGADGMHSRVRRLLFDREPARDVGLRALWGRTPRLAADLPLEPGHAVAYVAPGASLVLVEAARARPDDPPTWVWALTTRDPPSRPVGEAAAAVFPKPVSAIVARATSTADTRIFEQRPLATWWAPPVLLVGDAAHGMAPFLGLGANLAIADAAAFSRALAAPGSPFSAVSSLAEERARRLQPSIAKARRAGRAMHATSRVAFAVFLALVRATPSWILTRGLAGR